MTTTAITDAVALHADEGTGLTDNTTDASFNSAVIQALQATGTGVPWHTLDISNLDTTAETVDVGPGLAWVEMQSGVSMQSAADETYDTDVDTGTTPLYAVYFPTSTTVDLDADTSADLRLVIDPTTPDSVSVEHNTTPTDPSLVIGSADSGSGGTATAANVGPIRGSHDDLTGISSDDHHTKTSSAAELSDVSPDSTADAHHPKTSSAAELSDVSADSVTDAHHARPESISMSLGGAAPDATSFRDGDVVEDSDNPESLWFVYDSSVSDGVRRIDPGTGTNPVEEINPADVANVQFAHLYDGDSIDVQIQNALDALPGGQGKVIVCAPEDGSEHIWSDTLNIDPTNYGGVELDVNCKIDDQSEGWSIVLDTGGNRTASLEGALFTIRGGTWDLSGTSDTDGWLKMVDCGKIRVNPRLIRDCTGASGESTVLKMINQASFSESNFIDLFFQTVDRGYDSEITGDTGTGDTTTSMQDNRIRMTGGGILDFGMRFRGDFTGGWIDPSMVLGGDGAIGYVFDGSLNNVPIIGPEVEDPSGSSGTVGYDCRSGYNKSGIMIGGEISSGGAPVDNPVARNEDQDAIWRVKTEDRAAIEWEDIGRTRLRLQRNGDLKVYEKDGNQTMHLLADGQLRHSGAHSPNYTF